MKYLYFSLLAFLLAYQPTTQQQEQISETNAKAPVEDKAWQLVDTQNEPTARHENAFVQADGKFYLIGGRGERPVDIYDPATNTWSEGQTPPLEMHHFQAVSHEGKDYVMVGYDRQLSRRAAHSRHLYL